MSDDMTDKQARELIGQRRIANFEDVDEDDDKPVVECRVVDIDRSVYKDGADVKVWIMASYGASTAGIYSFALAEWEALPLAPKQEDATK